MKAVTYISGTGSRPSCRLSGPVGITALAADYGATV
jgi:hypothetical protein